MALAPSAQSLEMDGPALAYEGYRITMVAENLASEYMACRLSPLQERSRNRQVIARRPKPAAAAPRRRLPPSVAARPASAPTPKLVMDGPALTYEAHRIAIAAENLARQLLSGWKCPPGTPKRAKAANPDAILEKLYRRYSAEIRRYVARAFGATPADADDVVQAVFERYARQAVDREVANPIGFLVGMARNNMLDQWRRQAVRERYAVDVRAGGIQSDTLNAERIIASRQELSLIRGAIAALDDRSREMLLMSRMDGLSSAEIARRKNCSPALVKRIITRAVATCRGALQETSK